MLYEQKLKVIVTIIIIIAIYIITTTAATTSAYGYPVLLGVLVKKLLTPHSLTPHL